MEDLVFNGIKPRVVRHEIGMNLPPKIYTDEELEVVHEEVTDPAGYIDKSTQLQILQEQGQKLDNYLRSVYPNVYTDEENESYENIPESNPLTSRFADELDREEFVQSSLDYLESLKQDQQGQVAGIEPESKPITPSADGGSEGAGIGQESNN